VPLRRLEFTQTAKRDLDDVFGYTHEEWGLDQAFRYSDEMIHAVAQLSEFPNLGRDRSDLKERLRSLVVAHHVILYQVFDDLILVSRVIHERLDLDEALADLDDAGLDEPTD
jgi:toxin ParE1/3/4